MKVKTCLPILLLPLFLLTGFQILSAQSQLSGTVKDAAGNPLQAVSVLLLDAADSMLVKGQLSGVEGGYTFESIAPGKYRLGFSMIGFAYQISDPFTLEERQPAKNMGVTLMQEDAAQLQEVNVVAKKPLFEQHIDRLTVNVANSVVNVGGTALDVLQRSPGIQVNRQSNTLNMSSKSGVVLMINGKISRIPQEAVLQMLESMSADNIERIELIHTPPSNFDAEGNAGIINIVLKKTADAGLNGNYSLNAGYGKREKYGAGGNFNYRRGKMNLYGGYDYKFNHNPQTFTNYRSVRDASGDLLETDGFSDRSPDLDTQNGRLGADFQVSPKTVIGVLGTYFDRYWDMDAVNDIAYSVNGALDSRVIMYTKEINRWHSLTGNVNLSHEFSKDKTLTVDADYVYYKIHNPSDYSIEYHSPAGDLTDENGLRVGKETPINITVAKADYTQHFGKNVQFETGIKGSASRFDNDVKVEERDQEDWTTDPNLTSRFKLMEDVAAAYTSFSIKAGKKTEFKFGLRYEYTSTNLGSEEQPDVVDRHYGSWFPTAFASRQIDDKQALNFSYSRRIFRPGFTQLAPYLIFYDPTTIEGGNPALQPAFTDAVRGSYRYKTWQLSVEYNYESPSMRSLPIIDPEQNTQFNQPENNGFTHTAYAELNFPWQPWPWWDMQNNAFLVYQENHLRYEGQAIQNTSRFGGLNSTQTFTLPHQFSLEISGRYITPGYWGIFRWKPNGQLSIGIQKKLNPGWGTLTLNASDIFESENWRSSANQPAINLRIDSGYNQAERVFMLTWTNQFGNKKLKGTRQRATGAEEEMRRL